MSKQKIKLVVRDEDKVRARALGAVFIKAENCWMVSAPKYFYALREFWPAHLANSIAKRDEHQPYQASRPVSRVILRKGKDAKPVQVDAQSLMNRQSEAIQRNPKLSYSDDQLVTGPACIAADSSTKMPWDK